MEVTSADQALKRLEQGNERFRAGHVKGPGNIHSRRDELAERQQPFAIILSCSDSRVPPEMIFDTGLGELFVIRIAGNVANPSSIASVEFAVAELGTKLVVVMAHENCGAVRAAIEGNKPSESFEVLLGYIEPAVESAAADADDVAQTNARNSARRLISESRIIRSAVERGDVRVITAFYRLASGDVEFEGKLT